MPTEQELLDQLSETNCQLDQAQRDLAHAKEKLVATETNIIDLKLFKERTEDALRLLQLAKVIIGEDYFLYDD